MSLNFLYKSLKNIIVASIITTIISSIFQNTIIDKLLLIIIIVQCIGLGFNETKIVNPYFLFVFVPLSLLVYFNISDLYMQTLNHSTYLLGIINMNGFMIGLKMNKDNKILQKDVSITKNKLIFYAILFYILGISGKFIPSLSSILWLFIPAAIACLMKTKKKSMLLFVILILITSLTSGNASKMGVLFLCITIMICIERFYITKENHRKIMFPLILFCVFFMIFAFSFANKERGNYNSNEGLSYYETQGQIEWNFSSSLFLPYMYFTTPWANLQYFMDTQCEERTNGLWLIKPFIGYIGLDDSFKKEYELYSYSSFNTFTFIANHIKDFGYWGSVLISIFLGLFVGKVYNRYKKSNTPFLCAMYAAVSLATLEMFFSNHFLMQSYPFTSVIMFEIAEKALAHRKNI